MNRRSEGMWVQQQTIEPSPRLPSDHVLFSGAVSFPGAFDQLGYPLVVFPVAGLAQISSALSKAEVVDFINYCLYQHNKLQRNSLVSVVADLREASASSTRFIAESLLLLEQQKRTVHSAYIIQPKRRDVLRLLVKLWSSSKSQPVIFKKVLLKELFELSNYIDRSQLPATLGGYFVHRHESWAVFTKEMDAFEEHFISVAQRLPGCLSSLQALSMLPLPSSATELQLFCSTKEAQFKQLKRDLGLDDLLGHSEILQEKLGSPELDPHFLAMAGTAVFAEHFSIVLQKHRRITAAVKKIELLWHEAFSKAQVQLQVLQLRDTALQITEQIENLLQQKLQPYDIQIAGDIAEAERMASEFHSSVYTPAMSLVVAAEEVVHTLTQVLSDAPSRERWLVDLHRLKEKLHSTVHLTLQTLQAVSKYHRYYNKARSWYLLVLSENFLQKLLSDVDRQRHRKSFGTLPTWRKKLSSFLKNSPPPNSEELIHLAHLSNVIPDQRLQKEGMQLSQRCISLKRLIVSTEPLTVAEIQVALQWQYELLRSSLVIQSPNQCIQRHSETTSATGHLSPLRNQDSHPRALDRLRPSITAEGKPSSLSSFDSGFDGAGSLLEGPVVTLDCGKQALIQPQIQEKTTSSLSDSESFGSLGKSSRASVPLGPEATHSGLNFEIKVKRSAAHPTNPWLSLHDDDLENSYTVTITPRPSLEHRGIIASQIHKDLSPLTPAAPPIAWPLHSHSNLEDSDLGPIAHVLSSTITEPKDQTCTPADHSMVWDSYDLHEQYLDATAGVSALSLKDWDIKEEENLTEVERILERADKILSEEESVLAQEAQLDVLLQNELEPRPWLACNNQMSSAELTSGDAAFQSDPDSYPQVGEWRAKPDLLNELKEVHALDQKILEENLKIRQLRQDESPKDNVQRNSDTVTWQHTRMFHENEEIKQENPDKDDLVKTCQTHSEQHKQRPVRVIRCSIMSITESEEDRDVCSDLLSGQRSSEEPHSEGKSTDPFSTSFCIESHVEGSSETCSSSKAAVDIISSTLSQSDERLTNNDYSPSTEFPSSHNSVGPDIDSDHQMPDVSSHCSAGEERVTSCFHPIPKPRKATSVPSYSLNDEGVPTEDTVDHEEETAQTEDTEDTGERGALIVDPGEEGGIAVDPGEGVAPTEDTVDTGETGAPAEDPVDRERVAVTVDTVEEAALTEDPEDTGEGVLPEDFGDGSKTLYQGVNLELHTNNNNNNRLESLATSEETYFTEDVTVERQQTTSPHSSDALCVKTLPPSLTPSGVREDDCLPEGTKISAPEIQQEQVNINTTLPADYETPIILDTGSGLMKAGFADQDVPSVVFPTIIGVPKYEEIMNGSTEKDLYVGHEAQHMRGVLALRHPIKHGLISNWDDMEKIWQHTFDLLRVDPSDHPVLLSEAPMNPLENKQRAVEIMFEFFGVPYSYIAMQAVLALYAAGRTTGVVLDSGNGVTHSVPVYDGYTLPHAVQRFPLAGADVTANLTKLLQEQGVCMRTSAEQEIVREMKEKCCWVALDYEAELCKGRSFEEMSYTLPDGRMVTLGLERIRAPEILFKPELIGRDYTGLHESVYKSILSSDLDLRRCFLGNILLSGGNTLLPGLPERLEAELSALVPHEPRSSVHVCSPSDRDFSVWCGGAVMANLSSFCGAWISQAEYDEYGPQIVHKKCF